MDTNGCTLIKKKRNEGPQRMGIQAVKRARIGLSQYIMQEEKGTTGWDGWMASLTQSTWVWVNSGSWWWTGRPGVLQSMGSQRVGTWLRDWTELKKARQNLHPESNQPKCLLNKNQHFSENEVTQYWKHPVYEPNLFDIAKHTHILCLALSLSLAHPFTHPHSQKICPHWSREKNNQQMLTTR